MCGPSNREKTIQEQEQQFSQVLQQDFGQTFGNWQDILNTLNGTLKPIEEAGPNQTGFSPAELAALNTQAIDTTGAAAANVERAIGNETAGRNDSGNLAEAGNIAALKANAASAAEGQLSNEELGITKANYATGRANWQTALAGEEGLASQENPLGFAGATTSANKTAFGEADTIQQQENQMQADIAGGITSLVAGPLAGGISNLDTSGGSSAGEQFANFFSGAAGA